MRRCRSRSAVLARQVHDAVVIEVEVERRAVADAVAGGWLVDLHRRHRSQRGEPTGQSGSAKLVHFAADSGAAAFVVTVALNASDSWPGCNSAGARLDAVARGAGNHALFPPPNAPPRYILRIVLPGSVELVDLDVGPLHAVPARRRRARNIAPCAALRRRAAAELQNVNVFASNWTTLGSCRTARGSPDPAPRRAPGSSSAGRCYRRRCSSPCGSRRCCRCPSR